jgi:glycosyltransferase involved in cell wall biosynthesis
MTAALAQEEPTQASMRALLEELTGGVVPPDGEPMAIDGELDGEGEGLASAMNGAAGVRVWAGAEAGEGVGSGTPLAVPPKVAYLLPGLPPEGSGGSHSLVQEARGMRALGARAWICVPEESLQTAAALYGNDDSLFAPYPDEEPILPGVSGASVGEAVGDADVAVATEYPSVDMLARLARERPRLVCAYYVQDYEPLFAARGSSRADRALLSYRAIPDQLLFAKTRWMGAVVGAIHGVPVAKVRPSLDRDLFHARGRKDVEAADARGREDVEAAALPPTRGLDREPLDAGGPMGTAHPPRVVAMIRPRTPRRRPAATLAALALIAQELGEGVEILTFGCDQESFARLDGNAVAGIHHLGLLTRAAVAGLMRSCEVFIDGSAYQAFGRTGLEAMACGTVPVLPALGGVHEYAVHDENALILGDGSPEEMAAAAIELARDPARRQRLRAAGLRTAQRFSIERAARSQLELFAAAVARHRLSAIHPSHPISQPPLPEAADRQQTGPIAP